MEDILSSRVDTEKEGKGFARGFFLALFALLDRSIGENLNVRRQFELKQLLREWEVSLYLGEMKFRFVAAPVKKNGFSDEPGFFVDFEEDGGVIVLLFRSQFQLPGVLILRRERAELDKVIIQKAFLA
jgi:hypothetical protein